MSILKSLSILGLGVASLAVSLPALADSLPAMEQGVSEAAYDVAQASAAPSIVDIASSTEAFSTLTTALQYAGLVEILDGEGPFTVFAPTNDAFAALPPGTLDSLLLPENRDQLVSILTYHVVPGSVMSTDLSSGPVPTVEGRSVMVTVGDDGVMVNDASVVAADIAASNGIIHVIDRVILPPTE